MCVIMACDEKRPSEDMVRAAFKSNGHGGGVAWRETAEVDGKPKVIVKWKKGIIDPDVMVKLANELPIPFILHFRIASVGPQVPEMTHPFPVSKTASVELEGSIDGQVLFHNGTWGRWNDDIFKRAIEGKMKIPRGPWSDTRTMAWLTHLFSPGFLDIINEKVILFSAAEVEIFAPHRDWAQVEGIWCSNDGFTRNMGKPKLEEKPDIKPVVMGPQRLVDIRDGRGGDRPPVGFRGGPSLVESPGPSGQRTTPHQQKRDEGGSKGFRDRVQAGIVCAVTSVGERPAERHALTSNPHYIEQYQRQHGRLPAFVTDAPKVIGNGKRFRSSGRAGSGFGGVDSELSRSRANADKGISRVL